MPIEWSTLINQRIISFWKASMLNFVYPKRLIMYRTNQARQFPPKASTPLITMIMLVTWCNSKQFSHSTNDNFCLSGPWWPASSTKCPNPSWGWTKEAQNRTTNTTSRFTALPVTNNTTTHRFRSISSVITSTTQTSTKYPLSWTP